MEDSMEFKDLEQIIISQAQEIAELRAEVTALRKKYNKARVRTASSEPKPQTVAEVEAHWKAHGGPHNYVEGMARHMQLDKARRYEAGLED